MGKYDEKLAHALKLKFGTAPEEPNQAQLNQIKKAIQALMQGGRIPTDADWSRIVKQYCPGAGQYKYAGIDNSDLIALLILAKNSAGR